MKDKNQKQNLQNKTSGNRNNQDNIDLLSGENGDNKDNTEFEQINDEGDIVIKVPQIINTTDTNRDTMTTEAIEEMPGAPCGCRERCGE